MKDLKRWKSEECNTAVTDNLSQPVGEFINFDYTIVRKKRKTASITVKDDIVVVSVPLRYPDKGINKFLQQSFLWIQKKLKYNQDVKKKFLRKYKTGEKFNVLGNSFLLDISQINDKRSKLDVTDKIFKLQIPELISEDNREKLIITKLTAWYKEFAFRELTERTKIISQKFFLEFPVKIGVRTYKKTWGTCNRRREISYNWRIIMAPEEVVDSIVVHELCHLTHYNHSPNFWKLVKSMCPEYDKYKEWLRKNSETLHV